MKDLKDYVITIPDFPEKGIMFRDVTGILKDPDGLHAYIDAMTKALEGVDFDVILGPESRGFIFGMPVAYNLHKAFIPVRKPGKLPRETVSKEYSLEYGSSTLEIHKEDLLPGSKVVIIDDLIATAGTAKAIASMVEEMGASVEKMIFAIELAGLNGRELLKDYQVESIVSYEGK